MKTEPYFPQPATDKKKKKKKRRRRRRRRRNSKEKRLKHDKKKKGEKKWKEKKKKRKSVNDREFFSILSIPVCLFLRLSSWGDTVQLTVR